jgi:tetratricopeptide (TPR) repeat protein
MVSGFVYAVGLLLGLSCVLPAQAVDQENPARDGYVGNEACAVCHASIYASYSKTFMAHASGPATQDLMPVDFVHQKSGVHYRIYSQDGAAWLSFERPGDPTARGERELLYYIGSGRRGRSYLFAVDGFLFESPVNWYADRHVWDMAPAYGEAREIPLNLPAFTSCLHCHVSGMQPPVKGTENKYPTPAFTQAGVGCERCHGPGAAHVKGGAIVNPAKLTPERRDAICMQCHLEGKAAIERPGRHLYEFRPGDTLADYIRYYVLMGNPEGGLGAVSQVEALSQSVCKKKSGDAMSCTSCHNPHYSPSSVERVSYYRGKCLACHGVTFGAKHHPDKIDCTACHMPSSLSTDVAHTEVTDHRIPRRPEISAQLLQASPAQATTTRLMPFPDSKEGKDDIRDLALAWESLVEGGMSVAEPQAEHLLRSAMKESGSDPAILSALAYVEQKRGAIDRARDLYQEALAADPLLIDAATNLGVIEARDGHPAEAVKLWQSAFERAPGRSSIGMNLAHLFCSSGQLDKARTYTLRVLQFNPDLPSAKQLLRRLDSSPPNCGG